jgi:hypothetical protein
VGAVSEQGCGQYGGVQYRGDPAEIAAISASVTFVI